MDGCRHIDVLNSQEKEVRDSIVAAKKELEELKKEIEQIKEEITKHKASKCLPATKENCKNLIKNFIIKNKNSVFTFIPSSIEPSGWPPHRLTATLGVGSES